MEEWKAIKGYGGKYLINEHGKVYSLHKKDYLKLVVNNRGYVTATLWKDSKRKKHIVSRLVAEHFIPNVYNKEQVNHIDGNKLNNHVSNLEWVTGSENIEHAFNTGLSKTSNRVIIYCLHTGEQMEFRSMSKASHYLGRNRDFVADKLRHEKQAFYNNYRLEKVK